MRAIDADGLKEKLIEMQQVYNKPYETYDNGFQDAVSQIDDALDNLPTIDPVKHGKWIEVDYETVKCSECETWIDDADVMNYCPACGAKMDSDTPITKNLVPLIVKELGLEIGEVFTIRNAEFQYRFSDHWVEQDEGDGKWEPCRDELFIELIVGGEIIDKIPGRNERVITNETMQHT